mgnify:CR=1 FL=1
MWKHHLKWLILLCNFENSDGRSEIRGYFVGGERLAMRLPALPCEVGSAVGLITASNGLRAGVARGNHRSTVKNVRVSGDLTRV